jgi:hypothetical protein
MPRRRLVKVENKRLILTWFETFIEANGKQLTKTNIANKVSSICDILLSNLASGVSSLMLFAFSSPIKHFYELYVPCCMISFYLKISNPQVFFAFFLLPNDHFLDSSFIAINTLRSLLYHHC